MTLKEKNGIATGGRSSRGKSVSPTSLGCRLILPMTLPRTGMLSARRLRSALGSEIPTSTSLAGCSSCYRPSIAANFAGCPVRCPKKI